MKSIVILTDAGKSAESDIATFRGQGAATYWEYEDVEGVRKNIGLSRNTHPLID